ncbi:MAG: hypothetical protein ACE5GX_14830 [Thermoanaerobaculia bacterium]
MSRTELGGLLTSRGLISRSQLDRALERQQSFGGRLGTCLLEIGAISEEVLLTVLSDQLRVPTAAKTDLEDLSADMIALLPPETALNCSAVPFRQSAGRIDVALLDPGDLALEDELSFSIGKRIRPHLASELRIIEALHRYYGGAKPLRFGSLMDRIGHSAEHDPNGADSPRPSPVPEYLRPGAEDDKPSRQPVFEPPHFDRQSIPLTQEERTALEATRRPAFSTAPRPGSQVGRVVYDQSEFGHYLSGAETATQIGAALVDALSEHFPRVLLFRVSSSQGEVGGWMSHGPEIDLEWFRHYSVGLHQATVFRDLAEGNPMFIGRLEPTPAHQALARCSNGLIDRECLFLPVNVRGRLVCAVCLDRGDVGLHDVDANFLKRVAKMAALAFERCILRRKLQTT